MRQFLRDNPTLALRLGLPVLLVLVFSLAAGLPNLMAPAPKYDVIFATNYTYGNEGMRINVIGGKAVANYVTQCNYCQTPEIYRYNAQTGALKRLAFDLPPEARQTPCQPVVTCVPKKIVPIAIPELDQLKLNDFNPAPDGYAFSFDDNYTSDGLLPELFFASRSSYAGGPVLKKGTYRISLPLEKNYYNTSNVRFIGWVVSQ